MRTSGRSPERVLASGTAVGGLAVLPVAWVFLCVAGPLLEVLRGVSVVVALQTSAPTSEDWASLPILALMLIPAGAVTGLVTSSTWLIVARHERARGWAARALSILSAASVMTVLLVATAGPVLTASAAAAAVAVFLAAGPRALPSGRRPAARV